MSYNVEIEIVLKLLNELEEKTDKFFDCLQQSCTVKFNKGDIQGQLRTMQTLQKDIEDKVKEYKLNCIPTDLTDNQKEKDLLPTIKQEANALRTKNLKLQDSYAVVTSFLSNQKIP